MKTIFQDIDEFIDHLGELRTKYPDMKILTTCGGFDPPHVGHVRCFRETVKLKENYNKAIFVIIANGDGFLKNKKGHVFMPGPERMEVLQAFKGVDYVVNWYDGSQNCIGAIRKIKPHIFTKGGDRNSLEKIPEGDVCEEVGCTIIFGVGGEKIQSSSWLTSNAK